MCRLIAVADYKFYQTIASNNIYDAANYIVSIIGLELWCLTPLSTIIQLYRGS